jgi:outer membrane usher protein
MRRPLPLAVSLALASALVAAAPLGATSTAPEPAILAVRVNDQPDVPTLIVLREGEHALLVRVGDLPQLRLRAPAQGLVIVDGERYARFAAGDGASIAFDDAAQSVSLLLPPDLFLPTTSAAPSPGPPQVTPAGLGGFFNYDLTGQQSDDSISLGAITEAGVFGPFGVFTSSVIGRHGRDGGEAIRLDSTWTRDFPERLATLRVGDSISVAGAWGQSARFGGIQFGTNFATQPTLVTMPLLYAQGEALVPSTVDVFVNGRRIASENVPPGPFTIDRVPAVTGAGQMQVVVTDALGRQQVVSQPFYTGPTLLRAGLSEYSFEAGAIRQEYARLSNEYGDVMVAGTYRRGLTDRLTAELHAEGRLDGIAAAGMDLAVQAGTVGIFSLTAAAGGDGEVGWLAGAGFERTGRFISVFARARYASPSFAQLGTTPETDRPRLLTFGGLGLDFGRWGSTQASFGEQTYWTGPGTRTVGLSHAVELGRFGYLGLIASRFLGEEARDEVSLNWTLSIGGRRSLGAGLQYAPDPQTGEEFEAFASVQQALPPGSGAGYYASISTSEDVRLDYALQGRAGRVGVQYARRDGEDGWRAGANGGLAMTAAGIMPSRWIEESFAVVQVADYPGLTVYLENQPVAHTDRKGRVLLDSLRAYERNAVGIDPRELPLDASLASPSTSVTPAYRSGPVLRFPIRRASAATLRLRLPDGTPVPPGARITTPNEQVPVAFDGLVFLTAAEGRQQATAEWAGERCSFSFERPMGDDPQPDLGDVTCRAEGAL